MNDENNLLRKNLNTPYKVGLFFIETLEVFSSFLIIDNENIEFIGFTEECEYTDIGNKINVCLIHDERNGDYGLLFEFTDKNTLYDYVLRESIERYIRKLVSSITDKNNFLEMYFLNFKEN